MTGQELREQRAPLATEIRELADKVNDADRTWDAQDEERWGKVNTDYDALSRQIEVAERAEAVEAQQTATIESGIGREDIIPGADTPALGEAVERKTALAVRGWFRSTCDMTVSEEEKEACAALGIGLGKREVDIPLFSTREVRMVKRAMDTDAGDGGETIPEGFQRSLERALFAFGGLRQRATILRTASGNDLPLPTIKDVDGSGDPSVGVIVAESGAIGEGDDPQTGSLVMEAYKYTSKIQKISPELLEDSAFDMAAELGRMLGERIARGQSGHYATGTGSGQPEGITVGATVGVTAASQTVVTDDEILNLVYSLDPAYRIGAEFMAADTFVLLLRKLKDANDAYIWQMGLKSGEPDRLLGYPITSNVDFPDAASATLPMVFGQLRKYHIREVNSIRLKRLNELYAANDLIGFVAFMRSDGALLDAGAKPVKSLKMLT